MNSEQQFEQVEVLTVLPALLPLCLQFQDNAYKIVRSCVCFVVALSFIAYTGS